MVFSFARLARQLSTPRGRVLSTVIIRVPEQITPSEWWDVYLPQAYPGWIFDRFLDSQVENQENPRK